MATALSLRLFYELYKAMKINPPLFALTIKEAAQYLKVSPDSVRELINSGKLRAFDTAPNSTETGRRYWRITVDALEDFTAARGNG